MWAKYLTSSILFTTSMMMRDWGNVHIHLISIYFCHSGSVVGSVLRSLGSRVSLKTMTVRYWATGEDICIPTHRVFCTHGQKHLSQPWGVEWSWTYQQRLLQGCKSWEQGGVSRTKKRVVKTGWSGRGQASHRIQSLNKGTVDERKPMIQGQKSQQRSRLEGCLMPWLSASGRVACLSTPQPPS